MRPTQGDSHRKALAKAVEAHRKRLGLTQVQLAQRLGYLTARQVARIESGEVRPTLDLIADLATALECHPQEFVGSLFTDDDEPLKPDDVSARVFEVAMRQIQLQIDRSAVRDSVTALIAVAINLPDDDVSFLVRSARGLGWERVRDDVYASGVPQHDDWPPQPPAVPQSRPRRQVDR
jgi:transcriptional regulator with XRE-family HTH domain